jgi:hypothetical protein
VAELDIELDKYLIEEVQRLAVHLYGDCSSASFTRVVEVALEMRLLWQDRVYVGGTEIEEPLLNWESAGAGNLDEQLPQQVLGWLFKRRDDGSKQERSY